MTAQSYVFLLNFQQDPVAVNPFSWGYLSPSWYFSFWTESIDENVTDSSLNLIHADKRYMLFITLYTKATIF